ncbi:MAG: hypothetical protein Q8M02_12675, partial [Candidatus Didemnitutus sp.]|nr:hypothetical protein [Candidatus Didemnitutus sp.]
MANGSATNLLRYFHLLLFAALALLGVFVLAGWWMGQITWVQPRPFDFPIPANVGLCFLLFGVTPFIIEFWQRRIAVAVGL